MNEAIGLGMQDKSAHINSLNKTPVTILHEYAVRHKLCPQYNLIFNGALSSTKISFKYSLTLGKYEVVGEGSSKKEAKHMVALKLLNKMIEDNPELLNTEFEQCDFENHVVSPFDNNIKDNGVGKLIEICLLNKLGVPGFNLVREEGQSHAKLFTISCHVAKMIEIATHKTKKQAKHLSAVQMINKLTSINKSLVIKSEPQIPNSMIVLDRVENIKMLEQLNNNTPINENITNYHLSFKTTKWQNTEALNKLINQYKHNNGIVIHEPFVVLKTIVEECGMCLISIPLDEDSIDHYCSYTLSINNIYPPVYGIGVADSFEEAEHIAATDLLTNICILSI